MTRKAELQNLDADALTRVTGGAGAAGLAAIAKINMGAPEYSAAWWDTMRSRGLMR